MGKFFTKIYYRPFDERLIYFHDSVVWRTRKEVMRHMVQENIGLCVGRQWEVVGSPIYDTVFVTENIIDFNFFRRGGEVVFPLYLYPKASKEDLINFNTTNIKKPNIDPKFLSDFSIRLNKKITPEEIFFYIYSILHSPTYRTKYEDMLKREFPRIPTTNNISLFLSLCRLGEELVSLHLLKLKSNAGNISTFNGAGNYIVNSIGKTNYKNEKLFINSDQFFEGIPKQVYEFYIGGYQVCQKWLKDRKGQKLTKEDIIQYNKIIYSINETIKIMKKIDDIIIKHGGWPIK